MAPVTNIPINRLTYIPQKDSGVVSGVKPGNTEQVSPKVGEQQFSPQPAVTQGLAGFAPVRETQMAGAVSSGTGVTFTPQMAKSFEEVVKAKVGTEGVSKSGGSFTEPEISDPVTAVYAQSGNSSLNARYVIATNNPITSSNLAKLKGLAAIGGYKAADLAYTDKNKNEGFELIV